MIASRHPARGRSLIASLILLAVRAPAQEQRTFLEQPIVRAPFAVTADGLVLDVLLAGRGPYPFLLDTVSPGDGVVDAELLRQLRTLERAGPQRADAPAAVRLGGAVFHGLDLRPRELGAVRYRGTLGLRAFRDLLLTIDLSRRQIELYRGELAPDEGGELAIDPEGSCALAGSVAGRALACTLDTRREVGLELPAGWPRSREDIDAVRIAGRPIEGIDVAFGAEGERAVVGIALLRRFTVTLDQRAARARVRHHAVSAPGENARFEADLPAELEARRTASGHLLVRPRIDERDLGWFVFDTGASATGISNRVAFGAGLTPVGKGKTVSPTSTHETIQWRARTLRIGCATLHDIELTGLDIDEMSRYVGGAIGILGGDLLRRCVVEIDVRGARVALHDPRRFEPAGLVWQAFSLSKNVPLLPTTFEDHEGEFLLDSGDPGSITLFAPVVDRLDLLAGRRLTVERHAGVGGGFELLAGWLTGVTLGSHRLQLPPASFATSRDGMLGSDIAAGSIGCALLEPFTVLLDYPRRRLALLPYDELRLSDADLDGHVGDYRGPEGETWTVLRDGTRLRLQRPERPPDRELIADSATGFRLAYGLGRCEFVRDGSGATTHLVLVEAGQPQVRLPRIR
jgi:hypothetical protein